MILSCWTTPGVGRPGDGLLPVPLTRGIQMQPESMGLPTPALSCAHRFEVTGGGAKGFWGRQGHPVCAIGGGGGGMGHHGWRGTPLQW